MRFRCPQNCKQKVDFTARLTNPPEDPPPLSTFVPPLLPIATADDVTSYRRNDAEDAMVLCSTNLGFGLLFCIFVQIAK